jgi:hypothetical protein
MGNEKLFEFEKHDKCTYEQTYLILWHIGSVLII